MQTMPSVYCTRTIINGWAYRLAINGWNSGCSVACYKIPLLIHVTRTGTAYRLANMVGNQLLANPLGSRGRPTRQLRDVRDRA